MIDMGIELVGRIAQDKKGNLFYYDANGKYTGAVISTPIGSYQMDAKGKKTWETFSNEHETVLYHHTKERPIFAQIEFKGTS